MELGVAGFDVVTVLCDGFVVTVEDVGRVVCPAGRPAFVVV
jgi:hypothetical protein